MTVGTQSSQIDSVAYGILEVKKPTVDNPVATLQVDSIPRFQVDNVRKYKEQRKGKHFVSGTLGAAGSLSFLTWLALVPKTNYYSSGILLAAWTTAFE